MFYNKPNKGVWYTAYNLELTKKCYVLKISEGIHDEGAMKTGSSGFFRHEFCVMANFFNYGFIARWRKSKDRIYRVE